MEKEQGGIVVRLAVLVDSAAYIGGVVDMQAMRAIFEDLAADAVGVHQYRLAVEHLPSGALYGARAYAQSAIAGQQDNLALGVGAKESGFDIPQPDIFGLSVVLDMAKGDSRALRAFEMFVCLA